MLKVCLFRSNRGVVAIGLVLDAKLFKEKFNEARDLVKNKCGKAELENGGSEKENTPQNGTKETEEVTKRMLELEVSKGDIKEE